MSWHRRRRRIWASQLAQLARCEQKVVFEARHGARHTPREKERLGQGIAIHETLHREALARGRAAQASMTDGRCFVASAIYGRDAPETALLRAYRDQVLLGSTMGRLVVRCYYVFSPPVARWLAGSPRARVLVGRLLGGLLNRARAVLDGRT
jgi:hypothetical protein